MQHYNYKIKLVYIYIFSNWENTSLLCKAIYDKLQWTSYEEKILYLIKSS